MEGQEKSTGTVDSLEKDAQGAIRMGRQAARTAKTVSKAAAQAATGNVAGAVTTVVKDPQTAKKVLFVILAPILALILIIVMFLHALPTVIFETVCSYFEGVTEEWKEEVYSGGNDAFWSGILASIKAGGTIVGGFSASIWDNLQGSTSYDGANDAAQGAGGVSADDTELHVTQDEAAEMETLQNKMDAALEKVAAREQLIYDSIMENQGRISASVTSAYGTAYDEFYVNVSITTEGLTADAAVELLSLFTVQTNASLKELSMSDFLRWMGWYNSTNTSTSYFNLSNILYDVPIKAWNGTFLPQYLEEQRQQEIELYGASVTDFDTYRCAAVDFMIIVDAPWLEEIPIREYQKEITAEIINAQTGKTETVVIDTLTVGVADVSIWIHPRGVPSLVSLVGLWRGPLTEEQT